MAVTRRQFLKASFSTAAALALAACRPVGERTASPLPITPTVTLLSITATPSKTPLPVRTPLTLPDTEKFTIPSAIVRQDYRIYISLPPLYDYSGLTYPVLYMLDANGQFAMASSTVRWLESHKDLPELIVVGIGYPTDNSSDISNLRGRDLTPTHVDPGPAVPGSVMPSMSGSAGDFLRFIREELKPYIEAHYRTNPQDTALFGHSFGGLFCLYALFHNPDTFNRYIAGSPSIWWDSRTILHDENDCASKNSALPVNLFMGAGADEGSLVTDMQELATTMQARNYEGLKLKTYVSENEGHTSVIPVLLVKGLRDVFGFEP